MELSKIKISNFRGIKNATFCLGKHNVLLGQNNSGKSTVIDAIGFLLGRDRLAGSLGDYDFYGGSPKPNDRIFIKGLITGFEGDSPSSFPDWFNDSNGGIPVWFNPQTGDLFRGEKMDNTILGIEIAFCARFDIEELEYETVRYFVTGDTDPFEDTSINYVKSHTHLKELGFYLLPSKRTWDRTMTFNSELFRRVLKFQEAIPGQTVVSLRDDLRQSQHHIENQEPLSYIIERLNLELSGFITNEGSGISFLPTKGDVQGVLDNLTPFIEGHEHTNIPISKHGSGLISLQTLLLLLEFGRFRNESKKNFFLCAEEPELHLQPGLHRRLVGRIRGLGNQTLITTHSPEIAAYYKPDEILILNNQDGCLKVTPLLSPTESIPNTNSLMRLYTLYRKEVSEALMNKKIIIPEGLTDFRWIRLLINAGITAEGWEAYNRPSDRTKTFGILPTQSSSVVETYSKFIGLVDSAIPLVDGDAAGRGYISQLLSLDTPPKIALMLGLNCELEDLIEWIVKPSEKSRINDLELIMGPLNGVRLSVFLHTKKQHWGYQDALADYIITHPDCVLRARLFINSIYSIENLTGDYLGLWSKDKERSTVSTTVYQFTYPNI